MHNSNQDTPKPEPLDPPNIVIRWHGLTIIGYAVIWLIVYFWVAPELELPRTFALCFATVISGVPALISQLALRIYLELTSSINPDSP